MCSMCVPATDYPKALSLIPFGHVHEAILVLHHYGRPCRGRARLSRQRRCFLASILSHVLRQNAVEAGAGNIKRCTRDPVGDRDVMGVRSDRNCFAAWACSFQLSKLPKPPPAESVVCLSPQGGPLILPCGPSAEKVQLRRHGRM